MPTSLFYPVQSGARITMGHDAAQARRGLSWKGVHQVSVGTATAVTVMLTCSAAAAYEVFINVQADKAMTWTLSEAPNASGGTAIVAYNIKRDAANGPATLTHTVTYTSSGTVIDQGLLGASGTPVETTGARDDVPAIITAASGVYLWRGVAAAAATNIIVRVGYDVVV